MHRIHAGVEIENALKTDAVILRELPKSVAALNRIGERSLRAGYWQRRRGRDWRSYRGLRRHRNRFRRRWSHSGRDAKSGADLQVHRIHAGVEIENALKTDAVVLRELPESVAALNRIGERSLRAGYGQRRRGRDWHSYRGHRRHRDRFRRRWSHSGRDANSGANLQISGFHARIEIENALDGDAVGLRELPESVAALDRVGKRAIRAGYG